jgi:hypothetical protein
MKTIRRTIIIRESEYAGLCAKFAKNKLYDRAECEPLTYKGIQQENLIAMLKGEMKAEVNPLPNIYQDMLYREKHLYNRRYLDWDLTYDYPDGQIYVQSRSNVVKDLLVTATFEKDL